MEWNELKLMRQSCRSYTEEPVAREQVTALLEAACAAPVGHARYENVSLTVIRSKKVLSAISENAKQVMGTDGDPLYGAPLLILVSVSEQEGQLMPVSIANAACIMENMHLAATDLGLGSCYLWSSIQAISQNFELLYRLELKPGFWPMSALAVGHAAEKQEPREASVRRIAIHALDD